MTGIQVTAVITIPFDEELSTLHAESSEERRQLVLDEVKRMVSEELSEVVEDEATVEVTAEYKEESE